MNKIYYVESFLEEHKINETMIYNDYDENRVFYNPGDIVTVKHDVPNKPVMFVIEKCTRSLFNKDTQEIENIFLGIKCR